MRPLSRLRPLNALLPCEPRQPVSVAWPYSWFISASVFRSADLSLSFHPAVLLQLYNTSWKEKREPYASGYPSSFVSPYKILDVFRRFLPKRHAAISRGTSVNGVSVGGEPARPCQGVSVPRRAGRASPSLPVVSAGPVAQRSAAPTRGIRATAHSSVTVMSPATRPAGPGEKEDVCAQPWTLLSTQATSLWFPHGPGSWGASPARGVSPLPSSLRLVPAPARTLRTTLGGRGDARRPSLPGGSAVSCGLFAGWGGPVGPRFTDGLQRKVPGSGLRLRRRRQR